MIAESDGCTDPGFAGWVVGGLAEGVFVALLASAHVHAASPQTTATSAAIIAIVIDLRIIISRVRTNR